MRRRFQNEKRALCHRMWVPLAACLTIASAARPAFAIKHFFDEFRAVYVREGTPLAAAVDQVRCGVCHEGARKTDRNAYGTALANYLDKRRDKDDVVKIIEALATISKLPSRVPGKTFGDLLSEGSLPDEP